MKPVLKISVPKSYAGIVATRAGKVLHRRLKANGEPETVVMYPAEYLTRFSDLRLLDYSSVPLYQADTGDFDVNEVERLKQMILTYHGDKSLLEVSNEELYKSLGFVREQNGMLYPTITGILLIGKQSALKNYIPTSSTSFQVLDGTKIRMNEDITLPLLAMFDKLNPYLSAWNPEHELESGFFRIAVPDYDKRALREAIVNAFSHRDYTKMGRVRIEFSEDGVTIANPGGFIDGLSIDTLLTAEPLGRNPTLANALKRIGLAEKNGRGIDRIFEGSLLYGKSVPDYSASTAVSVSLFIPKSEVDEQLTRLISNVQKRLGRQLSVNQLLILNTIKNRPDDTEEQITEMVKIPKSTVETILKVSTKWGIVETGNNEKKKTYQLSHHLYKNESSRIKSSLLTVIDEPRAKKMIMDMVRQNERISKSDVVSLLHIEREKAYKLLKKLVDEDELVLINGGKYAKYKLK